MRNPLTKTAMADWCEKQPIDKVYHWDNPNRCAVAQYVQSVGFVGTTADFRVVPLAGRLRKFRGVGECEMLNAVFEEPHTFGALAQRLRS